MIREQKAFDMKHEEPLLDMFNACEQLCFFGGAGQPVFKFPGTYALLAAYKNILGNEFVRYNDEHNETRVLSKIQKDVAFQERFWKHYAFLQRLIQKCSADTSPAETVFSDEEIRFILCVEPKYVNRVKKQSPRVQCLLVNLDKSSLLVNPDGQNLAYFMTPKQVSSVSFDSRDINFEFCAVLKRKMLVKDTHVGQFPDFFVRELPNVEHSDRIKIVQQIEELGEPVFGKKEMEHMHASFVENDVFRYPGTVFNRYSAEQTYWARLKGEARKEKPLLAYIKNPDDTIKEKAIKHNPYVIYEIPQDDANQELALRVCAEKYDKVEKDLHNEYPYKYPYNGVLSMYGNPWILKIMYNQFLKNPSEKIKKLYDELVRERYLSW